MALQIKRLTKGDIGQYQEMFNNTSDLLAYNPFNKNDVSTFEWQFFDTNYHSSYYYIAYDDEDNTIVGSLAALIIPMKFGAHKVEYTIKPEDALINVRALKKYNFRDVFKELDQAIQRDTESMHIGFSWGFTEATGAFERLGFKKCFTSQQGVYTIKPLKTYSHLVSLNRKNKMKQKVQIGGFAALSKLNTFVKRKSTSHLSCKEIRFIDIDYTRLDAFSPKDFYSIHLDERFVKWRIIDNPSELVYGVHEIRNQEQEIIAYTIFSKKEGNVYFIEQFLIAGELTNKEKERVVYASVKTFKKEGAIAVRTMGFEHNVYNFAEKQLLKGIGFIYTNKGIPFILRTYNSTVDPKNLYLSRLNTQGLY